MAREPIPTWCFALVVVHNGDRFLLVHENKQNQPWYLPAGRVEPGESFHDAAVRETLEEAGIPIRLTGVVRVEHSPSPVGARMRVVFLAEPADGTPPKSEPDDESLGAAWVSLDELGAYPLRGEEVRKLFAFVAAGGAIYPLEVLQPEGTPFRTDGQFVEERETDMALLDAAFRLVSHSLGVQGPRVNALTDDARFAELRSQFPNTGPQALADALARARELEDVAIEMADAARAPRNDHTGPPLNPETLAARCPGFSTDCYTWAVYDGFLLTR